MKKVFGNKIVKTIFSVLEWILCLILVVLIILTGFQKFSKQGSFFGYRIYTIASGSMIPTYNIGDTLLIEEMAAEKINVGDAVTFISEEKGKDGMIITHQVIKIEKDENDNFLFHTKGIANNVEDPIVYEKQVLGKVVHKFFFLSILGKITTNMVLTFIFIIVPIAFIIAIELFKVFSSKDEDEDVVDEVEQLREYVEKKKKEKEPDCKEEKENEEPEIPIEESEEVSQEEIDEKFLNMFDSNEEDTIQDKE